MHEQIKKDILSVLEELLQILKSREDSDTAQIKELSNHTIHNASVFQDEDSVSIAILIYSLSKVIERRAKDIDYNKILAMINSCAEGLRRNDDRMYAQSVRGFFSFIRAMDERLRLYIQEVINQAQIKKGCKLCQHGISVARASEVLGISQWELMGYLGQTMFTDQVSDPINVQKRLKTARGLFQ